MPYFREVSLEEAPIMCLASTGHPQFPFTRQLCSQSVRRLFMRFMELEELVSAEETATYSTLSLKNCSKLLGTSAWAEPEFVALMLQRMSGLCHEAGPEISVEGILI